MLHTYTQAHIYIYIHMYIYTYIYMYVCMYACMYVYTHIWWTTSATTSVACFVGPWLPSSPSQQVPVPCSAAARSQLYVNRSCEALSLWSDSGNIELGGDENIFPNANWLMLVLILGYLVYNHYIYIYYCGETIGWFCKLAYMISSDLEMLWHCCNLPSWSGFTNKYGGFKTCGDILGDESIALWYHMRGCTTRALRFWSIASRPTTAHFFGTVPGGFHQLRV